MYRNIFDPFARKIVIQNLRHDSALSLFFPPKHIDLGCPPCPWGCPTTASAYTVRIFGFGLPVLEIQEVILCVICVSFKNSLFFEANYRFDKHSGFHVCLAKTFSISCDDGHKCDSKGELPKRLNSDWSNLDSGLIQDSSWTMFHGISNKWSKLTVNSIFGSIGCFR